jgi:hypothetical protein
MPPENVPYDTYTQFFVELLFRAGDKENAIKHLKGHVEKAKEMLAYITNMEAIYASNDIIGIAAENYDIINSMFEMVDEEMLAGDLGKYVFATDDEVSKMMKSWIEKIQKEDREKIALIQLTLPRYFTKDAEYALDAILEKDIKEGSKQIKEAGQYFQLISNVAVFVFNSSSDQGTMQDMQRLMQMTQGKVSDWLRKIMAADPSKQQEIVDAFPDLFNRGGRAPASGGGSLGGSL